MSPSLRNERFKMLFILSVLTIILSTIKPGLATDLVDLPLSIPSKSVSINATLTDANSGAKYFIRESIVASGATIKGKIVISSEKDSYNIYYNTDPSFSKKRLVIHGTNCLPFSYNNNWDQILPGIKRPVINLVLLMGPSILYRLDHSSLVWKAVAEKNIRGTMMKGATTEINDGLKITYYYKKHYIDDSGIKNPSRIEFSGDDSSSKSYSYYSYLILDIYQQNEHYYNKHANEIHPLPGIGCPYYLNGNEPLFPQFRTHYVHYTMYEHIQGSTTSRTFSEVHVSKKASLLRIKANVLGVTTEAVYDYSLGVSYLLGAHGSCKALSADFNSPGINSSGYFTLENLFLLDFPFKYVGRLNLEHQPGFAVFAWESVRFNVTISGKKADKAVITQYFAQSQDSEIIAGYTLVSTTIAIYKLDSSKKTYTLTDRITRDYINFEKAGSEDELHDIFSLKDCKYLISDKTLTLAFKWQPEGDNDDLLKLSQSHLYELKQDFVFNIIPISQLRIDTVQYHFNEAQLEIEVTFLDSPNLQNIFKSKSMFVSADTFSKMKIIKTNSENECLDKLAKIIYNIDVVIYRPSDSSCGHLTNFNDLKEDTETGQPCIIYHFPLQNLRRINQETPLEQLQNTFLKELGRTYWLQSLNSEHKFGYFKLIDVTDKTKNQVTSTDFYLYSIKTGSKINSADQSTVTVPNAKTLADCYRTCRDSKQLKCNTFSFCANGDCRVSSTLTEDSFTDSHVEKDDTCSIYALNILNDYSEVRHRKFKSQTSIAVEKGIYSCGEYCKASSECFSFQWCDNQCSFGGFYTDAATEYDEECSIYLPKVSEKYQKTGKKIVSDVLYTEMNLNFEQCASLCHGWSDGETGCKSFNYCPKSKTESSCSLSQFSVANSHTKTNEGGDCSNYELKVDLNEKKRKESSSTAATKGTSESGAFGIIMLFLFVGGLLGFAGPLGYIKVKQMRSVSEAKESFAWSRQVNEQAIA